MFPPVGENICISFFKKNVFYVNKCAEIFAGDRSQRPVGAGEASCVSIDVLVGALCRTSGIEHVSWTEGISRVTDGLF